MNPIARWCAALATSSPRWVLVITAILALGAAIPASKVGFDPTVEGWFLPEDGSRERYREFRDRFGNDEFLIVVFAPESGDIFRNEVLRAVRETAAALRAVTHVTAVTSLDDALMIDAAEDTLTIGRVMQGIPLSDEAMQRLRDRALTDPLVKGITVHDNGAATSLFMSVGEATLDERLALVRQVRSVLEDHRMPQVNTHFMGDAVLHEDLFRKVQHDLYRVLPLLGLVVAMVLGISLRSWVGVILGLAVVGLALVGTRALQGILGWGDSPLLSLVPVVLVVTGVADAVHLLDRFFRTRPGERDVRATVTIALTGLFRPCLMTTVTTAAGFLALTVSPLAPLQRLGVLAGVGVCLAFVVTMITLPAALVLLDPRGGAGARSFPTLPLGMGGFVRRRRRWILAATAFTTLIGAAGIAQLRVESRYLESFRASDPIRVEAEWIEEHVGGLASLEAVVTASGSTTILDPDGLAAVRSLERTLLASELVTDTRSVAGILDGLDRTVRPQHAGSPPGRAAAAQLLLLHEIATGDNLSSFLDGDRTQARIRARARFGTASEIDSAVAAFEACADSVLSANVTAELTGSLLLFRKVSAYLVRSQVRSLLFALITVTLFLMMVLKSIRLGLLSLIPNVWPLVLTLGLMGWMGWWLQPATVMVAAIALGIGVDDSVHFLDTYRHARSEGLSHPAAMDSMFNRAGRAVTVTTMVLVLGFAVTLGSSLRETALFAALCMSALGAAWVGDVFVLPCLLTGRGK